MSDCQICDPNIYPYSVFRGKYIEPFVFTPITVFYGNNGSGKSILLNIIANKLELKGKENATSNSYQVALAEEINKMARLLECQFIIATHSPFMLGILQAKIYNIDLKEFE